MNEQNILSNLRSVSRTSGTQFEQLSSCFPVLINELQYTDTKNRAKTGERLSEFIAIRDRFLKVVNKQRAIMKENTDFLAAFLEKNKNLLVAFAGKIELLDKMNTLIDVIKDESMEMEIISLNAMVVSIKSGKEGQAFSYITSNLKQLSLQLINQSEMLIRTEDIVQKNISSLNDTISEITKAETASSIDETPCLKSGGLETAIDKTVQSLYSILEQAETVKKPILAAMEGIQQHDIIRQSIDDIIIAIEKIEQPSETDSPDLQFERISANSQIAHLAEKCIKNIHTRLNESIAVFHKSRNAVNTILSEVEKSRKHFLESLSDVSNDSLTLHNCIRDAGVNFSHFVDKVHTYQHVQKLVLEKSDAIQSDAHKMQKVFNKFAPIMSSLQYVAIAQRIEVARNEAIKSIKATVEHMSALIQQTNNNIVTAQKQLKEFIDSSTVQAQLIADTAAEDSSYFAGISKNENSFMNDIENLEKELMSSLTRFTVYSPAFIQAYEDEEKAITSLEQLSVILTQTIHLVSEAASDAQRAKTAVMQKFGIADHPITNKTLAGFVEHFTIMADKQEAGRIGNIEIEKGAEAGGITMF